MKTILLRSVFGAFALLLITASISQSQTSLLAVGTLDKSPAGNFHDLSGLTYPLENGVRANELGGFGSAIANAAATPSSRCRTADPMLSPMTRVSTTP